MEKSLPDAPKDTILGLGIMNERPKFDIDAAVEGDDDEFAIGDDDDADLNMDDDKALMNGEPATCAVTCARLRCAADPNNHLQTSMLSCPRSREQAPLMMRAVLEVSEHLIGYLMQSAS